MQLSPLQPPRGLPKALERQKPPSAIPLRGISGRRWAVSSLSRAGWGRCHAAGSSLVAARRSGSRRQASAAQGRPAAEKTGCCGLRGVSCACPGLRLCAPRPRGRCAAREPCLAAGHFFTRPLLGNCTPPSPALLTPFPTLPEPTPSKVVVHQESRRPRLCVSRPYGLRGRQLPLQEPCALSTDVVGAVMKASEVVSPGDGACWSLPLGHPQTHSSRGVLQTS